LSHGPNLIVGIPVEALLGTVKGDMAKEYAKVGAVGLLLLVIPLCAPCQTEAPDDLTRPFSWPVISSNSAGIQFTLRTRWTDGSMQYVALLTDTKGKPAKYFQKHPDVGQIPLSSFHVAFYDNGDFKLYTIYIPDRSFSQTEGTPTYRADGESPCTQKLYRDMVKAAQTAPPGTKSIALEFPTELTETSPPPAKNGH
jgi:hypothetical protein